MQAPVTCVIHGAEREKDLPGMDKVQGGCMSTAIVLFSLTRDNLPPSGLGLVLLYPVYHHSTPPSINISISHIVPELGIGE